MFSSWQMSIQLAPRVEEGSSKSREESSSDESRSGSGSGSGSAVKTLSSSTQPDDHDYHHLHHHLLEPESSDPMNMTTTSKSSFPQQQSLIAHPHHHQQQQQQPAASQSQKQPHLKRKDGIKSEKVVDAKRLRRLIQNREAARKSRIRKKAYLQQLESSRMKLAQLELDLQTTRSQGFMFGGAGGAPASVSSGGATFDVEYGRWVEDDQRLMLQLRAALQSQVSEGDLRLLVDSYINHYDEIFRLKGVAAKSDVFHLLTGVWTSPAERCFLWMAGFRPSELIKMIVAQLEPLTEQQLMGICSLQQLCQQAEEALSQGLDQLQHSLVHTIAPNPSTPIDPMHQMALAVAKLSNLEGFVRQADNLRQQTLHQLRQVLTNRQAARCFLMIGDYYARLRALSSLWASCPRDQIMMMNEKNTCEVATDLQMVQPSQIHFSHF